MQDSTYKYYEIIMIDIAHKVVRMVRSALSATAIRAPSFLRLLLMHTAFLCEDPFFSPLLCIAKGAIGVTFCAGICMVNTGIFTGTSCNSLQCEEAF